MAFDYTSNLGGVYLTHVDENGVGVVSRLELTSSPQGQLPITQNSGGFILQPTFRQKEWSVTASFGGSDPNLPLNQRLSGNSPVAMAVDEMFNVGASPNQLTSYNGGLGSSMIFHSSKGSVLGATAPYISRFLFVALNDTGKIDVFDLKTHAKVKTLDIPGVKDLISYWRQ